MRCASLSELPAPPTSRKGWPWTEETPRLPEAMPDGQPWPRVSIVTPSYNQGRFVEETIRSVLLQGYPDVEYIIIDGGSTDGAVDVIKKYQQWLRYWVSEPDKGQSDAINKGFHRATGVIYNWLNSDDYLLKDALKHVAEGNKAHPEVGAWCGGWLLVDADGKTLGLSHPNRLDLEGIADWSQNHFAQPACFFSQRAWQQCGPLDEGLHYEMDVDLWIGIAKLMPFAKLDSVLAAAHIHKDSKIGGGEARFHTEQVAIQIRHGYVSLAIRDIGRWMKERDSLLLEIARIHRFPLLRTAMRIARIIRKKGV